MSIPLADVFLLWHTYDLTDDCGTHEEVKLIGLFSSEEKASEAMEQLKDKENGYQNLRSEGYRRKSLTERKGALLYMVCDHVSCALRGPARTSESPGRLRRYAPYKGLRPLRRFAAIPAHLTERHIRFASASFHQV